MVTEVIDNAVVDTKGPHLSEQKKDAVYSDVAATDTVSALFSKEQLEEFAKNSAEMMAKGKPRVDGVKNVAASHFYDTDKGKIGTFFMWIKGVSPKMYIGTEGEVIEMQNDFQKMCKAKGIVRLNPKERAEARKKQQRAERKKR